MNKISIKGKCCLYLLPINHFLRIMKVTVFLTCFVALNIFAANGNSQNARVTLINENTPLNSVLNEIERQTDYLFIINSSVNTDKRVTVKVKEMPVSTVLSSLFRASDVTYSMEGTYILLSQKPAEKQSVAQIRKITGKVLDETGQVLAGASVRVKNMKVGTITDVDGSFTLSGNFSDKNVLEISFLGMKTENIVIGRKNTFNVRLLSDLKTLNEIVVIGYGMQKKRDLTGAVTSIKSDVLEESKTSSFLNALQGRVAGVQITTGSGEPGAGSRVLIRGANTFAGSSDPLYVIDGIQMNESEGTVVGSRFGTSASHDPLSSINPADIVSIEVLKDASSTAIYGSKGANGVVIINTRQGKEGMPVVTYDGHVGVSYVYKNYDMLNADDWIDYRKDYTLMPDKKRIKYGYFNDWLFFKNPGETDPGKMEPRDVYALPQYNWEDEMYRTAWSTAHSISLSGGTQYLKYSGSLGYNQEDGLLKKNDYSRYNGRMRLDYNKDRIVMSMSMNASFSQFNGAAQSGDGYNNMGILQDAVISRPVVFNNPLAVSTTGGWRKPTENLNHIDKVISSPNISGTYSLNYKVIEGLYIGSTISGTLVNSKCNEFYGKDTPWGYYLQGRAALTNSQWWGWDNINTVSYDKAFKNNTKLSAVGAFELSGSKYEYNSIIKSNFGDETTKYNDISKGVTLQDASSDAGPTHRVSFLGRINYNIFDKYLFTASLRADGSDRFGKDNRWGYFPSMAFAWRISEEKFMKRQQAVDNLKLRLSYGVTGNSNIPEFQYMARMGNTFYNDELGLTPSSLENPKLKWETTTQFNVGIDFSLLRRIDLTVDVYDKKTTDMLYNAIIPAQSGFKTQWQNLGKVDNRGIEIALTTRNIVSKDFSWTTNLTFSANRNRVKRIGNGLNTIPIGAGSWSLSYIKLNDVGRIMTGQPIGVMYGYKVAGIYQMDDFAGWKDKTNTYQDNDTHIPWQEREWILKDGVPNCSKIAKPRPGTFKFANLDKSEDNMITESDKDVIGKSSPSAFGGFGNNFRYKNIELSLFFTYQLGGKIFNSTKYELEGAYPGEYYNITKDFWKHRWTPENPTNSYPSYSDEGYYNTLASQSCDYYVESASFLRLSSVSLAYTLPQKFVNKIGLKNMKIYYTGNNLFTITGYDGISPEVDSHNALCTGFDTIGYPRATSHLFGLNITF